MSTTSLQRVIDSRAGIAAPPSLQMCELHDENFRQLVAHQDSMWTWTQLSSSYRVSAPFLLANLDLPWHWASLSANPHLTWETVRALGTRRPWDWAALSAHPSVTWAILQTHKKLPWQWHAVCRNPNVTCDVMDQHPRKFRTYQALSHNPNITWAFVMRRGCNHTWNWDALGRQPRITYRNIVDNCARPWNWRAVHERFPQRVNQLLPLAHNLPTYHVSSSPWLQLDTVLRHPAYPWDWRRLSSHLRVTVADLLRHRDLPWEWQSVSQNANLRLQEVIDRAADLPWDWKGLSRNRGVTWEDVVANPEFAWDIERLLKNTMSVAKQRWIQQERVRWIKALQIQRHWRNCSCDPTFALARHAVLRRAGFDTSIT